ncbi:MAG: bifunctional hydroxymethylpyrimidine kinase/phosphomethylpyrimidine kinase [Burkholderiales bacterium]|nr:bifunctional hydroxymethylpyrimidine kinase/phosphomethylpyrimidine kinase [Burkholderiales bacterium]
MKQPIALTIAATDSSSGAGISADLATFAYFGVHGCQVISKVTAQNTCGISDSFQIPIDNFKLQLSAIMDEFKPQYAKLSVIGNFSQLNFLVEFFSQNHTILVYDPIFKSSSTNNLTDETLTSIIYKKLLPLVTLITPNIPEAEFLTGIKINNINDMLSSGYKLLKLGVQNVLIKGGHLNNQEPALDLFMNNTQFFCLSNTRQIKIHHVHGTGCHLSSAIVANLALGLDLNNAVTISKAYINGCIRNSYELGTTQRQFFIRASQFKITHHDFPIITQSIDNKTQINHSFRKIEHIGLYPIVENVHWVECLAKQGVKTIQLRIKNALVMEVENQIIQSINIANAYSINLYINDYWQLAIKHNAYGVHLGQEDLEHANIKQIQEKGLMLGISTHSYYELAKALYYQPSYIALGPIYPTTSKVMTFSEQGTHRLREWQDLCNIPLVAIGGINLDNVDEVLSTDTKNIAVISAITKDKNLTQTIIDFSNKINTAI